MCRWAGSYRCCFILKRNWGCEELLALYACMRKLRLHSICVRVCTSSLFPLCPSASWPKSCPFIQCDIHFLPAGRRQFDFSLRPHVLTFCKHVWLYVLTLLPSGCFAQPCLDTQRSQKGPTEIFRHLLWIPQHYYCQTFLPERSLLASSPSFCHIRSIFSSDFVLTLKCRGVNSNP